MQETSSVNGNPHQANQEEVTDLLEFQMCYSFEVHEDLEKEPQDCDLARGAHLYSRKGPTNEGSRYQVQPHQNHDPQLPNEQTIQNQEVTRVSRERGPAEEGRIRRHQQDSHQGKVFAIFRRQISWCQWIEQVQEIQELVDKNLAKVFI